MCMRRLLGLSTLLFVLFAIGGCTTSQINAHNPIPDSERITLNYVADFEFAPYRVATDEGYFGYEIDVNNAIFSGTKYKLEYRFEDLGIDNLAELARREDIDIFGWRVISPVTQEHMLVSDPVYQFNWGAVTLPEIGPLEEADYADYTIGITYRKYPYNYLVTQLGLQNVIEFDNYSDSAEALINGDIDIWFEEREITNYYLTRTSHYAPTVFHEETNIPMDIGLLIRPDLVDLHAEVNERIAAIRQDNQLESFYLRYFQRHSPEYLENQEIRTRNVVLASIGAIVILVVIVVMILRFNRKYRKTTKDLAVANTTLQETQEQYTAAVDGSNDGILYYSDRTQELILSERFCEILEIAHCDNFTLDQFFGVLASRLHEVHNAKLQEFIHFFDTKDIGVFTNEFRTKEGVDDPQWYSIRVKFENTDGNWTAGGVLSDITERKKAEANTLYFARHDYLTGIYNRMYLMELAREIIATAKIKGELFCVLYIDLDNFKKVNDTYGHDHGDEALQRVVASILGILPKDAVFARVGGDEFVIILPGNYQPEAICNRILEKISTISIHEIQIGASIGIACYPSQAQTMEKLIILADTASRASKSKGKNCWSYAQNKDS